MSARQPRIFRYEVTEVWGSVGQLEVGSVIVDRWKANREWTVYNMKRLGDGPTGWWKAKLLGEVTEPEVLAQIHAADPQEAK